MHPISRPTKIKRKIIVIFERLKQLDVVQERAVNALGKQKIRVIQIQIEFKIITVPVKKYTIDLGYSELKN